MRDSISIKTHSTESRFVIGPSNILFAGVYVCTFDTGPFTGWSSEGVTVLAIAQLVLLYQTEKQRSKSKHRLAHEFNARKAESYVFLLEVSSTDETNPAGTRKCIRRRWRRWRQKERQVGVEVEVSGMTE